MAVISFSDKAEETWCVAGWAFRQLLDDVITQYPNDMEMVDKLEQSKTHSGLVLDLLEASFADRISNAINHAANGILSGSIRSGIEDQPYGDEATVQQYLESLEDLLRTFPAKGDQVK